MKKISVIIPCYNVEKYIDRCMKSLEIQSIGIDSLEIILVDDASTDNTPEKLKQWEQKYEDSILLILCEENGRQGTARNIGMQYSSTDFITFIDADDWIEKDMLNDMYHVMNQQKDLDFVAGKSERDFGDGNFCNIPYKEETEIAYYRTQDYGNKLPKHWGGGVWAKLYRKSFLQSTNLLFPEKLTYEDNFWATILKYYVKNYAVLPKRYYHYFFNQESTVSQNDSEHHFDRLKIAIMTDDELRNRGLYEEHALEAELSFLRYYYFGSLHILFTRFSTLPYEVLSEMQKEVLRRYPDCLEGAVWNHLTDIEQTLLNTVNKHYTKKGWDEVASVYREFCKEIDAAFQEQYCS